MNRHYDHGNPYIKGLTEMVAYNFRGSVHYYHKGSSVQADVVMAVS